MNITNTKFLCSAPDLESCPDETMPEFAFAGRSNVGKSSLLNLIVGQRDLARVSPTPGHTKHLNFFVVNGNWRLVDLPGYGYAHTSIGERQRFARSVGNYLTHRPNLRCVFALIDASIPPQQSDLEFLEFLSANAVPFAIVFTKCDKVKSGKLKENIETVLAQVQERCGATPEYFTSSSTTRHGRTALWGLISPRLEGEHLRPGRSAPPPRKTPW